MIQNEKQVCEYLKIPSIPKKKWDGKGNFHRGVAVLLHLNNDKSYGVVKFEDSKKPAVIKTFNSNPFKEILDIFIVPSYMEDIDVETTDLDEESKERLRLLKEEVNELEGGNELELFEEPENKYYFDHIHNDDEARAYISAYNNRNNIRAKTPRKHDEILMRLSVIWNEQNEQRP